MSTNILKFRYKDETRNSLPKKILSYFGHKFSVKEASAYLASVSAQTLLLISNPTILGSGNPAIFFRKLNIKALHSSPKGLPANT